MIGKSTASCGLYERIICDEHGFTTVGMAISLLLALSLMFTSVQVYKVGSASAEIQEVADAAALAAQSEVGEFVTVVRVCDALVLSMSLLGVATYGAGIVAMCAPATAQLSAKLLEYGGKIFEARDAFAAKAAYGLNELQRALPFFATVSAARVASGNNDSGSLASRYCALAVLVPFEGEAISIPGADEALQLVQDTDQKADGIRDASERIEDLALRAEEVKRRAFEADCGASPHRCMQERAGRLAGLGSSENPLFQSVDAWSFSVALDRSRSYYAARLAAEVPSGSTKDQANSALRKLYYSYAVDLMDTAYVLDTEESFDAYFPTLPANLAELRGTPLYDEAAFPVTSGDGRSVAHAWSGCPGAGSYGGLVSARQLEAGNYGVCPQCEFSVSGFGNVAAASSSISNGFEYHYRVLASAVEEYEALRDELDPVANETKREVRGLLEQCAEVARKMKDSRLTARPPGSTGCIVLVADLGAVTVDAGSGFIGEADLGLRVAVAGATLLDEPATREGSSISSLLSGFEQDGGAAIGAARAVLDGWSALLYSYGSGQEGLIASIEAVLEPIPIVGGSGLTSWAEKEFKKLMESVGLQPADLDSAKPVLVNTARISSSSSDGFAVRYGQVQRNALSASMAATDSFSVLLAGIQSQAFSRIELAEDEGYEIARIDLPIEGVSIPIVIELPEAVGAEARGIVESSLEAVGSVYAERSEVSSWQ